jgi:hypothetical protein
MFPLLQLFFQGFLQCSILLNLIFPQQHLVNKITFKTHHETTLGRCGEVSKSKTLYANSSKMIVVIIFGLLSARRYPQYDYSNSRSDFAPLCHLAKKNEKISPTRNNNACSRCASHCNDISLDDTLIQQPIQSFYVNKSCRCAYSGNHSSRIHRDRSSNPWHLDSSFLAS